MTGAINHIEIYVSDLDRSLEFWSWFLGRLGYVEYQRWADGGSFRQGATYIVFVQTENRFLDAGYHRCRVGLNHIAFQASSKADVDELTQALGERNMTILYRERHPHAGGSETYAVFFEDPDPYQS